MTEKGLSVKDRLLLKIEIQENGCWHWTGWIHSNGYGRYTPTKGQTDSAHAWSYRVFVGPIPEGKQIDHICHNKDSTCKGGTSCMHRRCINPNHLETVTSLENNNRSSNHYANKTHCKQGHEFTEVNTLVTIDEKGTHRRCLKCKRAAARETARRRRARR
jgi:hypothetical protein